MDSCTFKNNKNDLINNYDKLYIKNSKFINNKGAIDHWGFDVLKISNSTFTNSSNDVAAVYSYGGDVKVIDCKFKCNSEAAIISCNKISITKNNKTSTYKVDDIDEVDVEIDDDEMDFEELFDLFEECEDNDVVPDRDGFFLMRELQKNKSKNTFKNKNAF
jgi:hypothetical protein